MAKRGSAEMAGVPPITGVPPGVPLLPGMPGYKLPATFQPVPFDDKAFFEHIKANQKTYIERLTEFVAIPGISAEPARRSDVRVAVEWAKDWLEKLGCAARLEDIGIQTFPDGSKYPLPPVLLGEFGCDPAKKTVLFMDTSTCSLRRSQMVGRRSPLN